MPEYNIVLRDGLAGQVTLEGDPADPESCYLLQSVSGLDSRELRDVVLDRPDRDGDYLGGVRQAGVVLVVELWIVGQDKADVREREAALRAALAPSSRTWPARIVGRLGDPENLTAEVRTSSPLRAANVVGNGVRLQPAAFAIRSADAVLYGATEHVAEVLPVEETEGFSFPFTFPLSFEGSVAAGTAVVSAGDASTFPVIRLHGPMTNVRIENLTTDQVLTFPGSIDAGTFLEVVSATRTITLGGDPAEGRYGDLDRSASSWWPLAPGTNLIRLRASTWAGTARAELTWRDAYL